MRFAVAAWIASALATVGIARADTTGWNNGQGAGSCGRFITADASGNIYVDDPNTGLLKKYTGSGQFISDVGPRANSIGGLAAASGGGVFIVYASPSEIVKYDASGNSVQTISLPGGTGNGQVLYVLGIATDATGDIYVLDAANRVEKFSPSGTYLTQWGSTGDSSGQFDFYNGRGGIAVASDGTTYVSDADNRIQKFSASGNFVTSWGMTGSGAGQFGMVGGLAVDDAGHVYAGDWGGRSGGYALQEFDAGGTFLASSSYTGLAQVEAATTFGNDLVYGYDCTFIYRFELTTPQVSLLPPSAATSPPATVTATVVASVPFGTITNYAFDFDNDGVFESSGASASATYTYSAPGTYPMTVQVTSSRGGFARATQTVTVPALPPPPPTPAVTTLAASAVMPTAAVLNATVNPNGAPTAARFEYGTSANLAGATSTPPQVVPTGLGTVPVNATLGGIKPGARYYFRVAATNTSTGVTVKGAIRSFATPLRIDSTMSWTFRSGKTTVVLSLIAYDVPIGAHVTVACAGYGCRLRSRTLVASRLGCKGKSCSRRRPKARTIGLTHLLRGQQLAPGARLIVSITQANTVGKVYVFKVRHGRAPSWSITCIAPGATKPGQGC